MRKYIYCNKGITLLEIIVSIALLGIILIATIPFFTMAAKMSNVTDNRLEATYVGKDTMELVYNISKTASDYNDFEDALVAEGYVKDGNKFKYYTFDDKYIELKINIQANLVRVLTMTYDSDSDAKLESQYEAYYILNK